MGLQRTPPHRAQASSQPAASTSGTGEISMGSPSRAFQPRNPGVMRSPLTGSTNARPEPPRYSEVPDIMPDASDAVGDASTTPHGAPPTAVPVEESVEVEAQADAYTTPLPKKRKSRHAPPAEEADTFGVEEEKKEPSQFEKNAMYGKRYQLMMDTLELAIKTSCDKWTWKSFVECFPKFAEQHHDLLSSTYESERAALRQALLADSAKILEDWRYGPALRKIEDAVQEARDNRTEGGRPDAWRADTTAATLTAAATLPAYDEAYARLREEYLALHDNSVERYASIRAKQARLREYESTVSDGVVDLDKTIKLLEGFPHEDMVQWMEQVMPTLREARS